MTTTRNAGLALLAAACVATALGAACDAAPDAVSFNGDAGAASLPPLESTPPSIIAPALRRDATSASLAFDSLRGGVWTANGDVGTVSYVDVVAGQAVREVAVGADVHALALSPDARWVAAVDRAGGNVVLLDANTANVARSIPVGRRPRAAVWDAADPRWLYVAVEGDDAIAIVDRTLGTFVTQVGVGRLPAGVAVSRTRSELYVTHRIDARVSVVDLASRSLAADVLLSSEPPNADPTVPQGTPFAFEGLAWAADGRAAWLPHELLAPQQPFQFRQTLFPAISVVDLAGRTEVQTDPLDPNGIVAGRKNLFGAINVLGADGSPIVVSQPCAAALHPGRLVGWALACASEDLVVFDTITGIAVDVIRNLPGDHPSSMTLDDAGDRLFVQSDQSHTLLAFDTGHGNPTLRTTQLGSAITLVAKDPIGVEQREGLKLFFRANSAKGPLATTANDWMSCGGCHLDGFTSTNRVLFEALAPADPRKEARIGHAGLRDFFASSPRPDSPSFDPHDILVALVEQGGLDADRTGAHPTSVVDPSAPTPDALLMAKRLAFVVARDLPTGPSWLVSPDAIPDTEHDGAWCGGCHTDEYRAWAASVHAHSADDPMVAFCVRGEAATAGASSVKLCAGCHDPVSLRTGDASSTSGRSITCLGCHEVTAPIRAGGNADLEAHRYTWTVDHKARAQASLATLRSPAFCGGCHQQFVPGTGLNPAFRTLDEWQRSRFAAGPTQTLCVDCHMPKQGGTADHRFVGGNVYMGARVGDPTLLADQKSRLASFMQISAARAQDAVVINVVNQGSGHAFPTGTADLREAWAEVDAIAADGTTLARYGGPAPDGSIADDSARLGMDLADADGTELFKHEVGLAAMLPFERRIEPGDHATMVVPVPSAMPVGTKELDAVLYYRSVRTSYYRKALSDPKALVPEVELARAVVTP